MWSVEVRRTASASRQTIWRLWTDVPNWNRWDKGVEYSQLSGEFAAGSTGTLKSVGGPGISFVITECTHEESFTNRSSLPFCTMDFIHIMRQSADSVELIHRVEMRGPLTFFFSRVIGRKLATDLPVAVDALLRIAQ